MTLDSSAAARAEAKAASTMIANTRTLLFGWGCPNFV
ncbi:hypothetical protein FB565_000183 [Actinoplanes lutulentus]|nr:hypothetical protein [Actinoplanes lutulentus]